MEDNKSKALSAALAQIEKQFGKGSIMRLGDGEVAKDIEVVSAGPPGLERASGVGAGSSMPENRPGSTSCR